MLWIEDECILTNTYSSASPKLKLLDRRLEEGLNFKQSQSDTVREDSFKSIILQVSQTHHFNEKIERKWHLSHHLVLRLFELGKVKFVFNAPVKKRGHSLNAVRLTEPYLVG